MVEHALALAARGFYVFPLIVGGKLPAIEDFPNRATRDPAVIRQLWNADDPLWSLNYNVGIYCGHFGDWGESLVVIDVDNKDGRNGSATLAALQQQHPDFTAPTYVQTTPTGGFHFVYRTVSPVRNSVGSTGAGLGAGLDIRGVGGFIVGAGSVVERGTYGAIAGEIAIASAALIARCGEYKPKPATAAVIGPIDETAATARVRNYLATAKPAVEGDGGNAHTFAVAARCKDLGTDADTTLALMMEDGGWNDRCTPPWDSGDLERIVQNAYQYGRNAQGSAAPEAFFTAISPTTGTMPAIEDAHPVNGLNRDHALVFIGGDHYVLWETTDAEGAYSLRYLSESSFHRLHTGRVMPMQKRGKDGKTEVEYVPATKLWINAAPQPTDNDPLWRRTYRGVWFLPGKEPPAGFCNLWRGFTVEPTQPGEAVPETWKWALNAWLEHVEQNVCRGDKSLAHWLLGWLAHMIQKPYEKPLVAVVVRGDKGSGKTSTFERVRDLLGSHAMVVHSSRFLTSQFNGHFESNLFIVMDEALYAGDKDGDSKLKGLVTGTHHEIERKGKEIYRVKNLSRVVVIGNNDWLTQASQDERRYAVFNVGNGRRRDKQFFEKQRLIMQAGGARLLLRYLLDFDLSTVDVNEAPDTEGLAQQKMLSLPVIGQWWQACLIEGEIIGLTQKFSTGWPDNLVLKSDFRDAVTAYYRSRNVRERVPADNDVMRELARVSAKIEAKRGVRDASGRQPYCYQIPPLDEARAAWDALFGKGQEWV